MQDSGQDEAMTTIPLPMLLLLLLLPPLLLPLLLCNLDVRPPPA